MMPVGTHMMAHALLVGYTAVGAFLDPRAHHPLGILLWCSLAAPDPKSIGSGESLYIIRVHRNVNGTNQITAITQHCHSHVYLVYFCWLRCYSGWNNHVYKHKKAL